MLDPDIATFAVNTKADLPLTEETLLILAEDNVVSLKEKETEITYDSVEIKTNQESIQKENRQLTINWSFRVESDRC